MGGEKVVPRSGKIPSGGRMSEAARATPIRTFEKES